MHRPEWIADLPSLLVADQLTQEMDPARLRPMLLPRGLKDRKCMNDLDPEALMQARNQGMYCTGPCVYRVCLRNGWLGLIGYRTTGTRRKRGFRKAGSGDGEQGQKEGQEDKIETLGGRRQPMETSPISCFHSHRRRGEIES